MTHSIHSATGLNQF